MALNITLEKRTIGRIFSDFNPHFLAFFERVVERPAMIDCQGDKRHQSSAPAAFAMHGNGAVRAFDGLQKTGDGDVIERRGRNRNRRISQADALNEFFFAVVGFVRHHQVHHGFEAAILQVLRIAVAQGAADADMIGNFLFVQHNYSLLVRGECARLSQTRRPKRVLVKLNFYDSAGRSARTIAAFLFARDDIARSLQAAHIAGAQIATIPPDFSECETAENALWHIPAQPQPTPAVWLGYTPDAERYRAIYKAALDKNIRLFNTPEQHIRAQEFDVAYPYLQGLTPRSFTLFSPADCPRAIREIGFPMFLKGAVQSRKARGWRACVAHDETELNELASHL